MQRIIIYLVWPALVPISASAADRIHTESVRFRYFILSLQPGAHIQPGPRSVFNDQGIRIGGFRIMDRSGDRYLCLFDSDPDALDKTCYVLADAATGKPGKTPAKTDTGKPGLPAETRFLGITFVPCNRDSLKTVRPVRASVIPDMSLKGIDHFMSRLYRSSGRRFMPTLLTPEEIRELGFFSRDRLLLGIQDGRVAVIYSEHLKLQTRYITEATLKQFKNELYIPILLKKK